MFSWQGNENTSAQQAKQAYAASLKEQVDQRQSAAQRRKQEQLEADRLDDERVVRESAVYAAQAQGEIQAQRDREAMVARREAHAAQMHAQASRPQTRDEKVEAYQRSQESNDTWTAANRQQPAAMRSQIQFGDDGGFSAPPPQRQRQHQHQH